MTLEFRPPYQIDPNRNPDLERLDRLNQTLQGISDSSDKRLNNDLQMKLLIQEHNRKKAEDARKMMETQGEWGVQAPSTMTIPIGGPVTQGQGIRAALDPSSPGSSGGLIQRFREWQSQRRGAEQPNMMRENPMQSQPLPQSEVGYNEVLPTVPGYTPDQIRAVGGSGRSSLGTKQTEQLTKLFPKEKPQSPKWSPVSGMLSKNGKPLIVNDATGEMREAPFEARTIKENPLEGLTPAQKAVDQSFGKEYSTWVAGGGYADTRKQIEQLTQIANKLRDGKGNLTGPAISMLPDAVRSRIYPDSIAAQQQVEDSIQRSLRVIMGPQFTEKEGLMFMKRGYDPTLDEKQNYHKLGLLIKQLTTMAKAKQAAADYYEANGTLKGFKGDLNFTGGGDDGGGDDQPTVEDGFIYTPGPGGKANQANWRKQ